MKLFVLSACLFALSAGETAITKATLRFTGESWSTAQFTTEKQTSLIQAVSQTIGWPKERISIKSAVQVNQVNTCESVQISALQRHLSGVYNYVQDVAARPSYKLATGEYYLYYYEPKGFWMVGSESGSALGELVVDDQSLTIAGITKEWYVSSPTGWEKALGMTVQCVVIPVLDVSFQMKAAGCAEAELSALAPLKDTISYAVEQQHDFVNLLGTLGFVTKNVKEVIITVHPRCDVALNLEMPAVKKLTGNAQAACSHDGQHLTVTMSHKGHDSFACKHVKNLATGLIECTCNTWDSSVAVADAQAVDANAVAP
jgi:hypothetical protein